MLSEEQLKAIEYQVTGFSQAKAAELIGIPAKQINNWNYSNVEYKEELDRATDTFSKMAQQTRTRNYRQIQKAIQDEILRRVEMGDLENVSLDKLFKMLGSSTLSNKQDEGMAVPSLVQNNTQINAIGVNPEFMANFGKLLRENMNPDEVVTIVEKAEKELKQD